MRINLLAALLLITFVAVAMFSQQPSFSPEYTDLERVLETIESGKATQKTIQELQYYTEKGVLDTYLHEQLRETKKERYEQKKDIRLSPPPCNQFVRGDTTNTDYPLDLLDALLIFNYLFNPQAQVVPHCYDAADANNDDALNVADGIYLLNYLFQNGPQPLAPFPQAGFEQTCTITLDSQGVGTLQAEDYETALDSTPNDNQGNTQGFAYGVDVETTTDLGGGYNVGWTTTGEWLEYTVCAPQTDTYDINFRVASGVSGTKQMSVLVDGSAAGQLPFTHSNGWQSWHDVLIEEVPLSAGENTLRVQFDTPNTNFNHVQFAFGDGVITQPPAQLSFSPAQPIDASATRPAKPYVKLLGDIDGDGDLDGIIGSDLGDGLLLYTFNNGNWIKSTIATGSFSEDGQLADIDNDGDLDIVTARNGANSGIKWYENPSWTEHAIGNNGVRQHDLEVGDLNNDGKIDVVVRYEKEENKPTTIFIQGTNSWSMNTAPFTKGEGTGLGDIDNDGDLDIANNGVWLENTNGQGTNWASRTFANSPEQVMVRVADINGDGNNDIVMTAASVATTDLALYTTTNPTGVWNKLTLASNTNRMHSLEVADMDNDGDLDIVTAQRHDSTQKKVGVYVNDQGSFSFEEAGSTGSHNMKIGDIDNDGDIDLFGANWLAQDHASAAGYPTLGDPHQAPVEWWENLLI